MRENLDGLALALLVAGALWLTGERWLDAHPQHDPWAPLTLQQPEGWATATKLAGLRSDPAECRAFLTRSGVSYTDLSGSGAGPCRRDDRVAAAGPAWRFNPAAPQATCAVHAAVAYWLHHEVQPAAREILGSEVAAIEHFGTSNCRRIGGGNSGRWSEHATGNAIDVAGFVLADGRRISIRRGWNAADAGAFLHRVRDGACRTFGTVLSPDYNAAHADHLHLDQAARRGFCR